MDAINLFLIELEVLLSQSFLYEESKWFPRTDIINLPTRRPNKTPRTPMPFESFTSATDSSNGDGPFKSKMNAKLASPTAPRLLRELETLNWRRGGGALSSRTVPSILIQSAVKQFFPGAKKYARAWRSCKFSGASALALIHFPRERRPRAGNNNSVGYNKSAAVAFSLSHAVNFDSQSGSYPSSSFALCFLFFFLISSRARLLFGEEESDRNWARRVKVFIQPASETDLPILWTERGRERER